MVQRDQTAEGVLIVGADVGATKVAVHQVVAADVGSSFEAGPASASVQFPRIPGFRPLPLEVQERQAAAGELDLAPGEREQARIWIDETALCVAAVANAAGCHELLLGVAAPGRKSLDGTGTVVVRNGPRIPDFAELLERRLRRLGVELLAPVEPLFSDGVCGCIGECRSSLGSLFDVQTGYYLGGGTGVAEGVLLGGRAWGLDAPHIGLPAACELASDGGPVYEDLVSMRAVERSTAPTTDVARDLAEFLFRRIEAFAAGACLEPVWLERIAIGQRLGSWLWQPGRGAAARGALEGELAQRIARDGADGAGEHYLRDGGLDPSLLSVSDLREAPAIGAGVSAWWGFG